LDSSSVYVASSMFLCSAVQNPLFLVQTLCIHPDEKFEEIPSGKLKDVGLYSASVRFTKLMPFLVLSV
jgi:type IV secretory pathway VirB3-like protein